MRLPLTLAIIDGMVVKVGGERYVVPTVSIVRTVQASGNRLATLLHKGEMFSSHNRLIPLFHLDRLFGSGNDRRLGSQKLVLVVEHDDQQIGLVIDELVGRQQVVIKTLGEALRDISGISGGAIMPDGRVGLIVDVDGLVRLATGAAGTLSSAAGGRAEAGAEAAVG
jgi:two-component system chemotaxis sensor kinase CheA